MLLVLFLLVSLPAFAQRTLTLTAPAGGENWYTGFKDIEWSTSGAGWNAGDTLTIEYSTNSGTDWATLPGTPLASAGTYSWDITGYAASTEYMVRVTCAQDGTATDTSGLFRGGPRVSYYVNDGDQTDDVYCTDVGNDANDGLTPATPKAKVQAILGAYDLDPGDTVFVDTGNYTTRVQFGWGDGGDALNPVVLLGANTEIGSTFEPAPETGYAAVKVEVDYVRLQWLRISGADKGITIASNTSEPISGSEIHACELYQNVDGVQSFDPTLKMTNCIVRANAGTGAGFGYLNGIVEPFMGAIVNNTFVGNGTFQVVLNSAEGSIFKNNIVWADGIGQTALALSSVPLGTMDYNDFYATNGASLFRPYLHNNPNTYEYFLYSHTSPIESLAEWRAYSGQDAHSLSEDPLFLDATIGDLHLFSTGGSWHGGSFTSDGLTSPCIDGGDPSDSVVAETSPDGARINMGAYGGTDHASKSPGGRLLTLVAPAQGEKWGLGVANIRWNSTGSYWSSEDTLLIEYSSNAGGNWTELVEGVSVAAGYFAWDVSGLQAGDAYQVRLTCVQDGAVDVVSGPFRILHPVTYYVNDGYLTDDIYTTTFGNDVNDGLSPATPKRNLQEILDTYDLEPGDTLKVDTGTYDLAAPMLVEFSDSGNAAAHVKIIGSTKPQGSTLIGNPAFTFEGVNTFSAPFVSLEYIRVTRTAAILVGDYSRVFACEFSKNSGGFDAGAILTGMWAGINSDVLACDIRENESGITAFPGVTVANCVIRENSGIGLNVGTNVTAINNVIIANTPGAFALQIGEVGHVIENNILWVSAESCVAPAIPVHGQNSVMDYNNIYLTSGGRMTQNGDTLLDWLASSGGDLHSITDNPDFVNPFGDYHLRRSSPCIDAGTNLPNMTEDFEGDWRPYNLVTDIGIDEYAIPSVPVVEVTPVSPTTEDNLICAVTTPSIVSPDITVQYQYTWTNGLDTVVHGPITNDSDTLSAAFTAKNQTWTCSVRGYNGFTYSDPAIDSVTIDNTLPGTLSLTIPAIESNSINLRCYMDKSPDPDNDVVYTVEWFVQHKGEGSASLWAGNVLTTSILTQIDATDTQPGDLWHCVVTYGDGEGPDEEETSGVCQIVSGGVNASFISLAIAGVSTITLGQTITVEGQILPTPFEPDKRARFFSTPPGGVEIEFPEDVAYNPTTGRFNRTFTPTEASEGRSAWTTYSHWNGDSVYSEADSDPVTFTVLKALPSVSLLLSASSAPMNFDQLTATATLAATIPDALKPLLANRTIRLFLKKPDASSLGPVVGTTDANGVATFTPQMFADAGIAFSDAGTWQFIAEFPGDDNFLTATSAPFDQPESVRLTIKDRAGYAVLVLGKLDADAEGHAEHARTADFTYRAFRERGFATEDIYYLREGDAQPAPDIFVSDTTPTKAEVQTAIQTWARAKMNAAPAPLYVVFIDHGATDAFYVYSGAFDATRVISPTDLDGYFDSLEGQLNGQALSQPRVFVYGACHSGSFIPAVSAENRVVITSAGADEVSHRGTTDPDTGVRDGEVFVTELFRNARSGKTLKESFELASERTEEYTATRSNDGTAELPQRALLDDNGDGAGSSRTALAFEDGYDGSAAHTLVLGYGVNAGDPVSWIEASQTRTLETGEAMGPLEARAIPAPTTGDTAWIEVKTPAYVGGELAALELPDFQQTIPMQRFDAEAGISEPGTGTYRWSDFGTTFDAPGTYKVFYYIKDAATGDVSTHILTTVFRA
ncbi:MAG: hypothetical protein K1Y02_24320, partial [Candidatus Hydrogenedentes bacterium]|nr:hypothetical protein [Candidatus Hydrogenedentota bacterium]